MSKDGSALLVDAAPATERHRGAPSTLLPTPGVRVELRSGGAGVAVRLRTDARDSPEPVRAPDDAAAAPRPPSAGRTATAAPGPRSEGPADSDSDADMLVPTPRLEDAPAAPAPHEPHGEPPRPVEPKRGALAPPAQRHEESKSHAELRLPEQTEPKPSPPDEPTPPAPEAVQARPPPPPSAQLEERGERCLEAHPDLASLFSKWAVLHGKPRGRPSQADMRLHMARQWRAYVYYRDVMDDYGEVFRDDDAGNTEVYGGGPSTLHFRVNSSKPEVFDIVTEVLTSLQTWSELPSDLGLKTTWNLLWTWSRPRVDFDKLLSWQRVNHYPHARHLTRKDLLARCIQRMQGLCARGKHSGYFDITPETYLLPQDYAKLVQAFRKRGEEVKRNLWILKPASSSRGRGISVIDCLEDITYDSLVVAQAYVPKPMCLGGHKFDLRLYVVATSFNPLEVWLYEDGFARVATRPFSSDDVSDKFVHLTNASIQRHGTQGELYGPLINASPDEAAGTKCTLRYLWRMLEKDGRDVTKMQDDIKLLILKSLVSAEDRIPHQCCAFELFGYDVLLDEDGRPWLLEVNASPSMARETPLDKRVKENLIRDIVTLVDPVPYDRHAVADVFGRNSSAQDRGEVRHQKKAAPASLARDLGALLPRGPPRTFGAAPAHPGKFRRLAPSPLHDAVRRVKRAVCRS